METFFKDVRYGARVLSKSPGLAAVIILTLALGIGANTAIFSVINGVLLRPLPYSQPERLVTLWERKEGRDKNNVVSPANFLAWKDESDAFEHLAAFVTATTTVTGIGEPEEITAQFVSEEFFPALGVTAMVGRTFAAEDCRPDSPDVVVLSYGYWQRRFGGDAGVVGSTITRNGSPTEIIGVMPAGFTFRVQENAFGEGQPELWGAIGFGPEDREPRGRYLSAMGRLKPGVSVEQAQSEMSGLALRLAERFPDFDTGWGIRVVALRDQFVGAARPVLLLLLAAVGFVLLIACANVANLLLARAAVRRKEIAIRTALGAGRARVIRQLLTESIILSGIGGIAGLILAVWGADLLLALTPTDLLGADLAGKVHLDWRVFGFALAASLVTGVFFGLAPAIQSSKVDLNEAMKSGGSHTVSESGTRRLRDAFVVAQVALSLVLLVGSGLLVRSLLKLQSVDPGFDADSVLTFRLTLPRAKYTEATQRIQFYNGLVDRLEATPGVRAASVTTTLPLGGLGSATNFEIEGRPPQPKGQDVVTDVRTVDPRYFATMGIPLLEGRHFTRQEAEKESGVVIVTETMARRHWPGESALGKRITINMKDENTPSEIVGVVADVRASGLDVEPREMVYWPHAELPGGQMCVVVRTEGEPLALLSSVRHLVQQADKDLPLADVQTMEDLIAESIARARFSSLLLGLFAVVAAAIAAVGLYGVMAHSVAQRGHEIGIRMALGAAQGDVLRMILSRGMALAGVGIAVGLALAFALARTVESFLFGTSPTDPLTFAGIAALLAGVALLACLAPARRAARLDPMKVLRQE